MFTLKNEISNENDTIVNCKQNSARDVVSETLEGIKQTDFSNILISISYIEIPDTLHNTKTETEVTKTATQV